MTLAEFQETLARGRPPQGLAPALSALWWAAKDDWDKAHALVMDERSKECARVHAYLHRLEGDLDNAHYWYRRAGIAATAEDLKAEWQALVRDFLAATAGDAN
jgi:hypothetical protein